MPTVIIPATHEEWLRERKNGLGASDSASIMGMSKWKSNVELWAEKTGRRQPEDISDKPQVKYGHDAEQYLRGLFTLDHPELCVTYESPYKIIRNSEYPFIFCTPDGELEDERGRHGGLEIKTTEIMNGNQWNEWKGRIPDQYYCQVCHQMLATGWEFVWLRAQIKWTTRDGEKRIDTRDYYIDRSEVADDLEAILKETVRFWELVQTNKTPALKLPEI